MRQTHARFAAILLPILLLSACDDEDEPSQTGDAGDVAVETGDVAADTGDSGGDVPTASCPDEAFGCVEVAPGAPIQLGTLLASEGDIAFLGIDSQRGVEMALDYLDGSLDGTDGQILGHPIELNHYNDGCSAEQGTTGALALAADPRIVAVVGTSCSSAGVPAAEILSEAGILTVSPSSTAPSLTDPENHQPFYARVAYNDAIQGAVVARFVAQALEAEVAATIHDFSPYSNQIQQVFADAFSDDYGGTITAQEGIDADATDFTELLEAIGADSPDVLYFPVFLPAGSYLAAQARQIEGLEGSALVASDGILTPEFIEQAGADAEDVYISGPDLVFDDPFYADEFLPAFLERYDEEPTAPFHAHAFDAARLIFAAIEEVAIQNGDGGLVIPRSQLRDAFFATSGFEGVVGTLTCDANGDCNPNPSIVVSRVQDGEFVPVWPTDTE